LANCGSAAGDNSFAVGVHGRRAPCPHSYLACRRRVDSDCVTLCVLYSGWTY